MEAVKTPSKTLDGVSSLAAKSKDPEKKMVKEGSSSCLTGDYAVLGSGPDGSVGGNQENLIRVSQNGKVRTGAGGGRFEHARNRVVDFGILAEKSLRDRIIDAAGAEEAVGDEDSEMKEMCSLRKMRERVKEVGGNDVKGVGKVAGGDDSRGNDGVSLVVDVGGAMPKTDAKVRRVLRKKSGGEENGGSLIENGRDPDGKIEEESEIEDDDGEGCEFRVGDFVWGKTQSHIWWPGRIYDPSVASEFALKFKQRNRLLVAYFGDSSFAWCHRSQLKPFVENFEEMSEQSNSKNFANAVQGAVDEIGKLVELEMSCHCVVKENHVGLGKPLVVNSGIKRGVFVPEGGIGKFSVAEFVPAELVADLGYHAQVVSETSMLDLMVLRSRLSAFYRSKGGYPLPVYQESLPIPGFEGDVRNRIMDISDFYLAVEVPIQGPSEEDWLSSPLGPGFGQTSQALLLKCSGDKLYQRRKRKSISEIMGGDRHNDEDIAEEGTHLGKPASTSGQKKRKDSDEADCHGGKILCYAIEDIKKTEISGSSMTKDGKVPNVEVDGGANKEEPKKRQRKKNQGSRNEIDSGGGIRKTDNSPVLTERNMNSGSIVQSDDGKAKDYVEKGSVARERKKSKYLSPPYTSPDRGQGKRDSDSLNVSSVAHVQKQMYSDETFQNSKDSGMGHETSDNSSFRTCSQDQNMIIGPMKIKASANEVLSEIRSAALNPLCLKDRNSLDMVWGFFSVFRSSIYRNGSNYKTYNEHQSGRKRKYLNSEPGSFGKDQLQAINNLVERESHKRSKKKEGAKLDKPKLKQAAVVTDMKTNDKETNGNVSPAASLFVSFGPGSSLPSRNDLIKIYSKFGALDEKETEMFYNNFCARIVFLRTSDAEEAFNISQMTSPFGAAKVNYRLRYLSGASKTRELSEISCSKASSLSKEGCKTPVKAPVSGSSIGEASELIFIRQKLKMMTSMLEKSVGEMSPDLKSKLEGDLKDLLEKVSTMGGSSSS